MKETLSRLMLLKLKADLISMHSDFYMEMRNDLPLDAEEFIHHFGQLGEIILKIDSCNSIQDLAMLHGRGELAATMGEDFQEFVYDSILAMEKSSK